MTLAAPLRTNQPALERQRALPGFLRRVAITDLLVVAWAVLGAQLIRFGTHPVQALLPGGAETSDQGYTAFSAVLIAVWVLMLRLHGAYDHRIMGHGAEEYKAVTMATFRLFGVLTAVSYLLNLSIARGYVALALPSGLIGLLVGRWLWRKWLTLHRAHGLMSASVLVVGDRENLTGLITTLQSVPEAGYHVVAACCGDAGGNTIGGIPVLGSEYDAADIARRIRVNTVACTSSARFDSGGLRRLGWALEGQDLDMVVVPRLTDVAGPRVLTRPVAGLSLLHVEAPVFEGPKLAIKNTMDRMAAAALLKFRTMVVEAEGMLASLQEQNVGSGPLFKLHHDPRITPIGARLRKYSLDELPQLINVLRGQMSLVGPRPPLAGEVQTYENDVRRRLLVKPGMTGLWQINGRSDLSWEESIRFDLYYVENWSVLSDLIILWHTGRAVLRSAGAY